MTLVDFHEAFIKLGDSRQKTTEVAFRVTAAEATNYFSAVTNFEGRNRRWSTPVVG